MSRRDRWAWDAELRYISPRTVRHKQHNGGRTVLADVLREVAGLPDVIRAISPTRSELEAKRRRTKRRRTLVTYHGCNCKPAEDIPRDWKDVPAVRTPTPESLSNSSLVLFTVSSIIAASILSALARGGLDVEGLYVLLILLEKGDKEVDACMLDGAQLKK